MIAIKQYNVGGHNFDNVKIHTTFPMNTQGKQLPFETILQASKFAEQHFDAYNILMDGVLVSVDLVEQAIKQGKVDGSYYTA